MARVGEILKGGWNAFKERWAPTNYYNIGAGNASRPDRTPYRPGTEKTIISSIYTRIAIDCASIKMSHVQLDEEKRFQNELDSPLNKVLNFSANIDQTGRAFRQDAVMSLLDEGSIAIIPTDTDENPKVGSYEIEEVRVAKIVEWFPQHIKADVYNERTGRREEILVPKTIAAIVENPFYPVMNQPNSTAKRLARKLFILDVIDEQVGSGKFNMVLQVPYKITTEIQRKAAEKRIKDVEEQLNNSKYGIAYVDGTEKIIQLNRALENNIMEQVKYLTEMLYGQLGITDEVMKGTADEAAMLNYFNRTIEPIVAAISDEMIRKFLTKTAITRGQTIMFFREPFKLVPINNIADIADKFTRNEILSPNEVRGLIGFVPSPDPEADQLRNRNINESKEGGAEGVSELPMSDEQISQSISELDAYDAQLKELEEMAA